MTEQISLATDLIPPPTGDEADNLNADLALQHVLRVLRGKVITEEKGGVEIPSFVLISHGHAVAGLLPLSLMTRKVDGKEEYLFDVSAYFPMGGWKSDNPRLNVATYGAQIWGNAIANTKSDYQKAGTGWAGGIAIALNGHRGDWDPAVSFPKGVPVSSKGRANIEPVDMLGPADQFAKFLRERGMDRVVIVVENYIKGSLDEPHILPLHTLWDAGGTFARANRDLGKYMMDLEHLGVRVIVVAAPSF